MAASPTPMESRPSHQTQSERYPMPPSAARATLLFPTVESGSVSGRADSAAALADRRRRLFFLMMKEAPMKTEEQMARSRPTKY